MQTFEISRLEVFHDRSVALNARSRPFSVGLSSARLRR